MNWLGIGGDPLGRVVDQLPARSVLLFAQTCRDARRVCDQQWEKRCTAMVKGTGASLEHQEWCKSNGGASSQDFKRQCIRLLREILCMYMDPFERLPAGYVFSSRPLAKHLQPPKTRIEIRVPPTEGADDLRSVRFSRMCCSPRRRIQFTCTMVLVGTVAAQQHSDVAFTSLAEDCRLSYTSVASGAVVYVEHHKTILLSWARPDSLFIERNVAPHGFKKVYNVHWALMPHDMPTRGQ